MRRLVGRPDERAGAQRAWPRRRGLWRHRDFLLFWSAQGISAVGSRITRTALPMAAILAAGATALDLGALSVASMLPGVLIAWVAGGWVDRHPRRPILVGTDLVRACALVTIPIAALTGHLSLRLLYGVAGVTSVATVLASIADHVFITNLVSRKRLQDANGKREAVDALAEISGPAIGGALVALLTAPLAIAVDAATFVVSALLVGRVRRRESVVLPPAATSFAYDVRSGINVVWTDVTIRTLFVATAMLTLCMGFMAPLYTLYALTDLGVGPAALGIAIGCGGIGGLAGALAAAPAIMRWGARRTLIGALVVAALAQGLIPLAPPIAPVALVFLIVTQVVGDGALTIYLINETTLRQQLLPPAMLGRAAATWQVAIGVLTPVGAVAGAVLADVIGMRPTLWALAIGVALTAGWLALARHTLAPGES